MGTRFLLVSNPEDSVWPHRLEQALAPLGQIHIVPTERALTQINKHEYKAVIIDATVVEHVEMLISQLRAKKLDCRIVVMTASPTWRRARAAFEAGAIDYIPKSFNADKLFEMFKQILQKPLPPWPR